MTKHDSKKADEFFHFNDHGINTMVSCHIDNSDYVNINSYINQHAELVELRKKNAELELIVKAVAHIGVDFGYGVYEIEPKYIEDARQYFLNKEIPLPQQPEVK